MMKPRIKMVREHRGQMTYYYARAAFASIKNFCFTDGKAENCSIFVPGGQGWQMTFAVRQFEQKTGLGTSWHVPRISKKITNSFGFTHYILQTRIVLMNLSVFTHGFYITINSVMHIISIVDVWRANSHVFKLVLTVQYLKITQKESHFITFSLHCNHFSSHE